jgi:hypothetical protein
MCGSSRRPEGKAAAFRDAVSAVPYHCLVRRTLRLLLVAVLALTMLGGGRTLADVSSGTAANVQDGDNESSSDQAGSGSSGDAVAGQVAGVVSSGDASVDATNRSENVDAKTGDADGTNDAATFTGLNVSGSETIVSASDLDLATGATNVQEGDNQTDIAQTADATSGDGVGGQVIGVVTTAGGSADVVQANTSKDVDVDTGDAEFENCTAAFDGLSAVNDFTFAGCGPAPTRDTDEERAILTASLVSGQGGGTSGFTLPDIGDTAGVQEVRDSLFIGIDAEGLSTLLP